MCIYVYILVYLYICIYVYTCILVYMHICMCTEIDSIASEVVPLGVLLCCYAHSMNEIIRNIGV